MPMLRFTGFSEKTVATESCTLVDDLCQIIGCPRDYFTLEVIQNTFIFEGEKVAPPAIIEVAWFDRGQEIQDAVAKCINHHFSHHGELVEIYFTLLKESNYYEHGEHY